MMKGATWQEAENELVPKKEFEKFTLDTLNEIEVGEFYYWGVKKIKYECISIEAESLTGVFCSGEIDPLHNCVLNIRFCLEDMYKQLN